MLFSFRFVAGQTFSLDIPDDVTITDVKSLIHSQFPWTDPRFLRLVHHSTNLENSLLLSAAGISPSDCIAVIWRSLIPNPLPAFDASLGPGIPGDAVDDGLSKLLAMGFEAGLAKRALDRANGKVEAAIATLLNHPEMLNEPPMVDFLGQFRVHRLPPDQIARLEQRPELLPGLLVGLIESNAPQAIRAIAEHTPEFLRVIGLNPARFNIEAVRNAIVAAQSPRRLPQMGPGGLQDVVGPIMRLHQAFSGLELEVVMDVFHSVGEDERRAWEQLREIAGTGG
jgi:hypothetical protein